MAPPKICSDRRLSYPRKSTFRGAGQARSYPDERPLPCRHTSGRQPTLQTVTDSAFPFATYSSRRRRKGFSPRLMPGPRIMVLQPQPLSFGSAKCNGNVTFHASGFPFSTFQHNHLSCAIDDRNRFRDSSTRSMLCLLRGTTSGNQVLPVQREIVSVTDLKAADNGFPRCVTARLLAHTVHLRTATLPLRGTLQPLLGQCNA